MSENIGKSELSGSSQKWYEGITRYQWLVLLIASLGWVFDIFEGQIFVASMREAMPSLLPEGTDEGAVAWYNNIALASFLLGGAFGGVLFGILSDRIGRTKTMIWTILMYSCFTCVTAFAETWWQMAGLRFLVAMGVGGEWAVASAMVAEVFPNRARAWSGAIFHGSSVLGTYLAIFAGAYVVGNPDFGWRWGFALGALPALLTLWIRWKLKEPDCWVEAREKAAKDPSQKTGRLGELFSAALIRNTLVGVVLAAVGLATFWGVHIYGKDFVRRAEVRDVLQLESVSLTAPAAPEGASEEAKAAVQKAYTDKKAAALKKHAPAIKSAEMLGMFLVTTGGGIGLLAFGLLCEWLGRRGAFLFYHVGGLVSAMLLFQVFPAEDSRAVYYVVLPLFGFLTLGMHAGYAIYFPELYPTRLRGTGGGFCFNVARFITVPMILLKGFLQKEGYTPDQAGTLLSWLFLIGVVVLFFAPETKGKDLPE